LGIGNELTIDEREAASHLEKLLADGLRQAGFSKRKGEKSFSQNPLGEELGVWNQGADTHF